MRAMKRVTSRLFGNDFSWEGVTVSGHLDPLIFAELAALNQLDDPGRHHDVFRDQYLQELRAELESVAPAVGPAKRSAALPGTGARALPGVHEALTILRDRRDREGAVTLGLLTGNYTQAVPVKLHAVEVDPSWFEVTAFGDEAATRADLVALAMEKYARIKGQPIEPQRVIVVGDTPRDIHCAHAHGCVAYAVATGAYPYDDLSDAGADVVVEDLSDLSPLLRLIGPSPKRSQASTSSTDEAVISVDAQSVVSDWLARNL